MVKGAIGAALGGVAGAAIWAAVGFFTGYEVGYVAWGVGILVGIGASIFADRNDMGMALGVMAAIIAGASVAGGKYATVYLLVNKEASKISVTGTAEEAKVVVAHQVAKQYQEEGKAVNWPAGVNPEDASEPNQFPADLWKDAEGRWEAMGEPTQQALIGEITKLKQGFVPRNKNKVVMDVFMNSFGALDLLWFGLAVVTAFQMGAGKGAASGDGTRTV